MVGPSGAMNYLLAGLESMNCILLGIQMVFLMISPTIQVHPLKVYSGAVC